MAEQDARPSYGGHSRARSKSTFSFKSSKSDSSDPSRPKVRPEDLKETEGSKARSKFGALQTTRDPNRALREEQPADRNIHEARTLPSLANGNPLRDWKGDVISDPDASNPTRSRMERPLDTIRSFEAAIDSNYRRKRPQRTESADATPQTSTRNSVVGDPYQNRYSTPVNGHSYNGSRGYPSHSGYRDGYGARPGVPRHSTTPGGYYPSDYNYYPSHGYHESHDTVNTGVSHNTSGSEPWTNSTDPSSENSSIDRIGGPKQEHYDAYGNPYPAGGSPRHDAIQEEYVDDGYGYAPNQYPPQRQMPPYGRPPQSQAPAQPPAPRPQPQPQPQQRQVIQLGGDAPPPPSHGSRLQRPPPPPKKDSSDDGKRKSWLRRRFSKG